MARYFDIHPENPQPRLVAQIVELLNDGGLIAYPTTSGYALGCKLGNKEGLDRIRAIRHLGERHNFTLLFSEFAQIGQFVEMDNDVFRALKAAEAGEYTFILKATREAPRMMLQPKRKSVGVRLVADPVGREILAELGEPLVTSTLILPDSDEPMFEGWLVNDELGHDLDGVVDSGECGRVPTTIIDFTDPDEPVMVVRVGAGDPTPFE